MTLILRVPLVKQELLKRQKDRQYNGQKTEGQTIQWPKDRRTDHTMAKIKRTKRKVLTIIYKALHRKLKLEQHKPHQYQGKTQVPFRERRKIRCSECK
jgi:hypothetical protein